MIRMPDLEGKNIYHLLHILLLPLFFLCFIYVFSPEGGLYGNLSADRFLITLTMPVCLAVSRLLYLYLQLPESNIKYGLWCLGEVCLCSLVASLFLVSVHSVIGPYHVIAANCMLSLSTILIFPYVIMFLLADRRKYMKLSQELHRGRDSRMIFNDYKGEMKLVIDPTALLYVSADENYVNIVYVDNGTARSFVLRNSMKGIDRTCLEHGMCRCHRSFYINPVHIKSIIREDTISYAELDVPQIRRIPVAKASMENLYEFI